MRIIPLTVSLLTSLLMLVYSQYAFDENIQTCSTPQHHAFDFWIGDWQVHTPDGKLVGHNHITREYGTCVIHEHYKTERGYSGESLNIYDATRKVWHQTWVDSDGTLLVLEGRPENGGMQMSGKLIDNKGKSSKQRITWTRNVDGSVRQLWEAADDKGSWSVVFDGKYTHQASK
ncbi:MAG TPA: hypothetical protein VHL14_11625 [Steroidobacteraceae bacterium]|nr:hypothetical protein [Steroidobacteraceae bacterium]